MKICVTFLKTPEIEDYALIAEANRAAYCKKNGYDVRITSGPLDEKRSPHWSTITNVLEILEEDKYDWVFKTDADALIKNFDIKIENLIDENYDFIFTKDAFGAINSGNYLVKNSDNAKNLLRKTLSCKNFENHPWHEQCGFIETLKNYPSVKYVPQREFNSYPPESGDSGFIEGKGYAFVGLGLIDGYDEGYQFDIFKQREGLYHVGDFLIHMAGIPHKKKIKLMTAYESMLT